MRRTHSTRAAAAAAIAALAALAPPAAASAWIGQADWTYRSSWYSYVHVDWPGPGPQGVHDILSASGATEPSTGVFRHGIDGAATDYDQGADEGVAAFDGLVRSLNEAHYIDVRLEDPRVEIDGDEGVLTVVAQYLPLGETTLTTPARIDFATLDLEDARTVVDADTTSWADVVPELTAAGATVFNGGGNGSYAEGTPFGELDFEISE